MDPAALRRRTKKFAVDTIRFAKRLPNDRITNRFIGQLTGSAGAVASGYRAVRRARSRADFIYKLGNTLEEADESALWLEILAEAELAAQSATDRAVEGGRRARSHTGPFTRNRPSQPGEKPPQDDLVWIAFETASEPLSPITNHQSPIIN